MRSSLKVLTAEETNYKASKLRPILESLLVQGVDVNYSCQKGSCSSCVAKVITGAVDMKHNNALMDFEVDDGFVLCCQSIPTTSEITISFDEY